MDSTVTRVYVERPPLTYDVSLDVLLEINETKLKM